MLRVMWELRDGPAGFRLLEVIEEMPMQRLYIFVAG